MEIIGILISLLLLMYLAYRGYSVIIIAPILALLAVAINGEGKLLAFYTQIFMTGLGGFVIKYFPVFLLGSVFGKLMEETGAAGSIAKAIVSRLGNSNAIAAIVLSCAILTYGGVSLFVVAFATYPLAAALFREANVPKRLIPGAIALGAFTFSMTALPGTVQIQNLIPMPYFQTNAFAAPIFGLIASAIILSVGLYWFTRREKAARKKGEGYGEHAEIDIPKSDSKPPTLPLAVLPVAVIIIANYLLANYVIPSWNLSFLNETTFGSISAESVSGLWAMILAMVAGIVALLISLGGRLEKINQSLVKGANGSLLPIFNTASEVGYGATIASLAGFAIIKNWVLSLSPENPLISEAVAVNILAGITGSASGGLSIAMEALGEQYYQLALEKGIDPELLHRVASMACGGLDSLPHNGAVITSLAICGLSHKESYLDIGVATLVIPLSTLALMLAFSSLFI